MRRRVADSQLLRLGGKSAGEFAGNGAVHQDAAGGHADLSLMQIGTPRRIGDGDIDIGIVEDDQGVLSAKFQRDLLQMGTGQLADLAPGACGSSRAI